MNLYGGLIVGATFGVVLWFFFPNLLRWISNGRTPCRLPDDFRSGPASCIALASLAAFIGAAFLAPPGQMVLGLFALMVMAPTLGLLLRWHFQRHFQKAQ